LHSPRADARHGLHRLMMHKLAKQNIKATEVLFRQDTIDAVVAASTKPARGRKYVAAIHTSQQTRSAA
jgi:hypothetical protein